MMRGGGGMEVRGGLGQWVWCHADVYWLLVATMVGMEMGSWVVVLLNGNTAAELGAVSLYSFGAVEIHFVLLISRQGKVRLTKWYSPYSQKERTKVIRELSGLILTRGPKLCNFVEWRGFKVVYKRYASLYFCMCINQDDNELEVLEIIHHFVEILDRYFGSVCELDLIFNFHKESSKKSVARLIAAQDSLVEAAKEQSNSISNIIAQATK
ncbi:hypothetical protein RHSIM_Rhsim06G0099200 [Rhododendron simsii]|uniref:Adaptor AP-1 19 kDa protein n=1 Tax=Rhododendron simsii TaxID=118357 RepID=A0A834GW90_RHOSS|nr:hypothetical protein RHSIM_Rhsim06G0099200 [Rhododendron simsii]